MTKKITKPTSPEVEEIKTGKVLVPSYKENRQKLKENLISLRSQGNAGKEIAMALLSEERQKDWYKKSQKPYMEIVSDLKKRLENSEASSETLFSNEALETIYDYHKKTGEDYDKNLIELIDKVLDLRTPIFVSGGRNYQYYDNYNHTSYGGLGDRYGFNCNESSRALDTLIKFIDILAIEKQEKYLSMAIETTNFVEDRYTYYTRGQRLQEGAYPAKHDKFDCVRSYSSTGYLSDTKDLYSCKRFLEPLLIKVFLKTQNSEFINSMIVPLINHGYDLKKILPKEISDKYLIEENIKNIFSLDIITDNKAYLGEVLLSLHKNGVNFSQESLDYCISIMNDLEKKMVPLVRTKTGFSNEGMPIQDVFNTITSNNQKNLLKNIYRDGILDIKRIQELKKMYSSSVIWQGIEKDCLNVEFINLCLDDLSDILDNDGIMYVLNHINISNNGKKLDEKILKKFSIYDIAKQNINPLCDGYDFSLERESKEISINKQIAKLVIQKVDLQCVPKNIPGYAIYDALSDEGILNEKNIEMFSPRDIIGYYSNAMTSIHSTAGTPLDYYGNERYKRQADNILDTRVLPLIKKHIPGYVDSILQSGNLNKIKNIIQNDGYCYRLFRDSMSKEQKNSFIDKILENIDTQEDLQFLEKYLLGNNYHYGFNYFNLPIIYLIYRFYGKYPSTEGSNAIPASIYKDMVLKGIVKGTQNQAKIIDDSQLKIPNLDKIISLFEQKKIKSD